MLDFLIRLAVGMGLVLGLGAIAVVPLDEAWRLVTRPRYLLDVVRDGGSVLFRGYNWLRCVAVIVAFLGGEHFLSQPKSVLHAHNFPLIVKPALTTEETASGLRVNVPVGGTQCWASPRPCTPSFFKDLEIGKFGEWEMMRRTQP